MLRTLKLVKARHLVKSCPLIAFLIPFLIIQVSFSADQTDTRIISKSDYLDKVHGWWQGKIIGVTLGFPYEFKMPWPPKEITFYTLKPLPTVFSDNDDLYVNLAYLLAAEKHGPGVSQEQMGLEFVRKLDPARLWLANWRAYKNLLAGVKPPKTGHPVFNEYFDAIDAQIENGIWGVLCPGMIDEACEYADKASHITNYADGAYGGIFVAAMTSAAFFEKDVNAIVRKALKTIPAESDYARAVRDVIEWHREEPENWRPTREKIKAKWEDGEGKKGDSAVVNGASVVMALLYGEGNFDKTVTIATMGGWDADCNPSTAGGILGVILGERNIPSRWKIFNDTYRNLTLRDFPESVPISDLALRTANTGGKFIKARGGQIVGGRYLIPVEGPAFTAALEMGRPVNKCQKREWAELRAEKLEMDIRLWNPLLTIQGCPADGTTGLLNEYDGRRYVFKTRPDSPRAPCRLKMKYDRAGAEIRNPALNFSVSSGEDEKNRWELMVYVGGSLLDTVEIGPRVPEEYQFERIIPRRDEDIVLYIANNGSTYYDEELTRIARPGENFDPGKKAEPLRVQSGELFLNLFKYRGALPPGREEIRSYEMLLEWVNNNTAILNAIPGVPHRLGLFDVIMPKAGPDLPLDNPQPVKIRIAAGDELPEIPAGGECIVVHDGGTVTKVSLPAISARPCGWYDIRYDLSGYPEQSLEIELVNAPLHETAGHAYWDYIKIEPRIIRGQESSPGAMPDTGR